MDTFFSEKHVRTLLTLLGEDPHREGLRETPRRVLNSLREMTSGYQKDPQEILATTFDAEGYGGPIVLRNIRFSSLCEHHLLPFSGTVSIGYVPDGRVVGLSKLARLVNCFARRLQIQERLTRQILEAVRDCLNPKGVAVLIRAKHGCLGCRGVNQRDAEMVTSELWGEVERLREVLAVTVVCRG